MSLPNENKQATNPEAKRLVIYQVGGTSPRVRKSTGAARDNSPRRQPWVSTQKTNKPQRGGTKKIQSPSSDCLECPSVAPSGLPMNNQAQKWRGEPASPVNLRGLLFFVVTALACGDDYSASENETISLSFRTSTFRLANAGWLQTTLRFIALPVGSIRCALSIGS